MQAQKLASPVYRPHSLSDGPHSFLFFFLPPQSTGRLHFLMGRIPFSVLSKRSLSITTSSSSSSSSSFKIRIIRHRINSSSSHILLLDEGPPSYEQNVPPPQLRSLAPLGAHHMPVQQHALLRRQKTHKQASIQNLERVETEEKHGAVRL